MQRGERQLQLGFHAGDPHDSEVHGVANGVLHQSGLADAGLASDDEDRTLSAEHRTECGIQFLAFVGTSP